MIEKGQLTNDTLLDHFIEMEEERDRHKDTIVLLKKLLTRFVEEIK
jgi:hypothetical protein